MANPLARVVMRNIVSKKGEEALKRGTSSSSTVKLDSREDNLLKNIINSGQKAKTVETLNSLNPKKPASSFNYQSKPSQNRNANSAKSGINNLKTLDSLSNVKKENSSKSEIPKPGDYGLKSNYGKNSGSSNQGVKAVSLESLVSGKSDESTSTVSIRTSSNTDDRDQSGMMSLNQLAASKAKVSSSDEVVENETDKAYVRSNVIGNLSAYVPKVTLDSIGKKGSLF